MNINFNILTDYFKSDIVVKLSPWFCAWNESSFYVYLPFIWHQFVTRVICMYAIHKIIWMFSLNLSQIWIDFRRESFLIRKSIILLVNIWCTTCIFMMNIYDNHTCSRYTWLFTMLNTLKLTLIIQIVVIFLAFLVLVLTVCMI